MSYVKNSLLMVSGGPDSVFLFYEFLKLKKQHKVKFDVVHFNHNLRGKESQADATFVKQLARKYRVRCHLVNLHFEKKSGLQEMARKKRYASCENLIRRHGYDFLVTAHQRDDLIETIVMNKARGAGIAGCSGIRKRQIIELDQKIKYILWRPLLTVSKEKILRSLARRCLDFRVDSSNIKRDYLRSRVRQDVMIQMPEGEKKRLIKESRRFRVLDGHYAKQVRSLIKKYLFCVPLAIWQLWPEEIRFRFFAAKLLQCGFLQQVERRHFELFETQNINKMTFGLAWAMRDTKGCYFVKKGEFPGVLCPLSGVKELRVDRNKLKLPLRLAAPVLSQKFIPYGRTHAVPLKKLFQSKRFGVYERLFCPVVTDAADRIVAVMGVEIADEFKVTVTTKNIFKISAGYF